MRGLSILEYDNVEYLKKKGAQLALVCLTQNILRHGLFDAKKDLRDLLKEAAIHDYSSQQSGDRSFAKTRILSFRRDIETISSMYRAGTRGDARMWFGKEIYDIAKPDDIVAIIPVNGVIFVLPISHIDIEYCCTTSLKNPIKSFFSNLAQNTTLSAI